MFFASVGLALAWLWLRFGFGFGWLGLLACSLAGWLVASCLGSLGQIRQILKVKNLMVK